MTAANSTRCLGLLGLFAVTAACADAECPPGSVRVGEACPELGDGGPRDGGGSPRDGAVVEDAAVVADGAADAAVDAGPECDDGLANCDGDPANGCETDLRDRSSCGGCDVVCELSQSCSADGRCVDHEISSPRQLGYEMNAAVFAADGTLWVTGAASSPTDYGAGVVAEGPNNTIFLNSYEGAAFDLAHNHRYPTGDTRSAGRRIAVDGDDVFFGGVLRSETQFGSLTRGPTDGTARAFIAAHTARNRTTEVDWLDVPVVGTTDNRLGGIDAAAGEVLVGVSADFEGPWLLRGYDAATGAVTTERSRDFANVATESPSIEIQDVALGPDQTRYVAGIWKGRVDFGIRTPRPAEPSAFLASYTSTNTTRWFDSIETVGGDQTAGYFNVVEPSNSGVYALYATSFFDGSTLNITSGLRRFGVTGMRDWTIEWDLEAGAVWVLGMDADDDTILLSGILGPDAVVGGEPVGASIDSELAGFLAALDSDTQRLRWFHNLGDQVGGTSIAQIVGEQSYFIVSANGVVRLGDEILEPVGEENYVVIRVSER